MYPEQSRSPVLVQISDNMMVDGIAVRIALRHSLTDILIGKVAEHGSIQFQPMGQGIGEPAPITFSLQNDFARALLEALLRHYNGSEDARTTRADLLHERQRVDKLVGVVCEIAHDSMITILERD